MSIRLPSQTATVARNSPNANSTQKEVEGNACQYTFRWVRIRLLRLSTLECTIALVQLVGEFLCWSYSYSNAGLTPRRSVPKSPSLIHPIYADPATLPPGFVMPLPSPDVEHGQSEQDLLWAAQSTQLPGSSPLDDKKRSSFDSIRSNSGVPPNINVDAANTHFSSSTGQPSGGIPVRQRSASPTYTTHPQHQSMTQPMTVSPSGSSNGMSNTNRPLPPLLVAFGRLPPGVQQLLDGPMAWLSYYFVLNLGLTLCMSCFVSLNLYNTSKTLHLDNKFVLVKFPYPWALTGVHSLCGALGSYFLLQQGFFVQARLSRREIMILILFSMLYTINIAVSNLSLNLVTVPFHQVVRATTPIFTILINVGFMNKKTPLRVYLSLIPVVVGVGAATYGEYAFTLWGFFLTVLGAVLAAVKGIATNVLLVGRWALSLLHRFFLSQRCSTDSNYILSTYSFGCRL